jgi:hypothetical protein
MADLKIGQANTAMRSLASRKTGHYTAFALREKNKMSARRHVKFYLKCSAGRKALVYKPASH